MVLTYVIFYVMKLNHTIWTQVEATDSSAGIIRDLTDHCTAMNHIRRLAARLLCGSAIYVFTDVLHPTKDQI